MANKTDKPLNYTQFKKSLKESKTNPVYIFYGDEEYFISEAIKEVRSYLADKYSEVEYTLHDKSSGSLTELIFNAKSQSLFGSKKLFVVKDCDRLTKEENKEVENYINNPTNSTCLILIYSDKKKIKLDSIANTILVHFPSDERNVLAQLGKIVENMGYNITRDALSALVDLTGSNLVDLTNELNKLILFLKDQKQITREPRCRPPSPK